MKLIGIYFLLTSFSWPVYSKRRNEEFFGYEIRQKTLGHLMRTDVEIRSLREEQLISVVVAKDDLSYETKTLLNLQNKTSALISAQMDECGLRDLSEQNFEQTLRLLKAPPHFRLGVPIVVCDKKPADKEKFEITADIEELCEDKYFEIGDCSPAIDEDNITDKCFASGFLFESEDKGSIFCIRKFT